MTDQKIFAAIHDLAGKSRLLDFFGIFFAEYLGYLLVAAAIFLVWISFSGWKKRFYHYSFLILAVIFSRGILAEAIRIIYYRPRPFTALNFKPLVEQLDKGAFPSGHAAFYFALAGAVFLINKKWGQYFLAAATLMGVARVFAGVHWPLDIVGGAAAGFLSVWAIDWLLNKSNEENQKTA